MNTNQKGTIAEAKVAADLLEKGYIVSMPLGDLPFDLICLDGDYFYKIQVKYCKLHKNNYFAVNNYYISTENGKRVSKKYDLADVDIIAIYVPDLDECFYMNYKDLYIKSGSMYIRTKPTKNNQVKNVNFALNYKEFPARA